MCPIGLSTCGKRIDAALFTEYAQNGIAAMELSLRDYTGFDFPVSRRRSAGARIRRAAVVAAPAVFAV